MNEMDLSYFAGFFDGEGYIGILKRKRKDWNTEYFIQLSIGQKDGATMDWIKETFGGHLHLVKRDKSYYWIASNKEAYRILKLIVPFLRYKRPQAELAIKFYEERNLSRPIPYEELARRENIYLVLKAMKHDFIKSTYC